MKCKKHLSDTSSSVGVCASCLRERLLSLVAAQPQLQRSHSHAAVTDDPRLSDSRHPPPTPPPQHLLFPRSVSPYVARRKSDYSPWSHHAHFYSTPQVGPAFNSSSSDVAGNFTTNTSSFQKKRSSRLSFLRKLFRSKSEKLNPDPSDTKSSTSSPAWLSAVFRGRREMASTAEFSARRPRRTVDRGMSSAVGGDCDVDCDDCDRSGCSSDTVSPWKRTPVAASVLARGSKAFCLSPLVRATPNREWNQKCVLPAEGGYAGEIRFQVKPSSFCKNRSKKLADFGRVNRNR